MRKASLTSTAILSALEEVQAPRRGVPPVKSCCVILSNKERVKVTRHGRLSRRERGQFFHLAIGPLSYSEKQHFKRHPEIRVLVKHETQLSAKSRKSRRRTEKSTSTKRRR